MGLAPEFLSSCETEVWHGVLRARGVANSAAQVFQVTGEFAGTRGFFAPGSATIDGQSLTNRDRESLRFRMENPREITSMRHGASGARGHYVKVNNFHLPIPATSALGPFILHPR